MFVTEKIRNNHNEYQHTYLWFTENLPKFKLNTLFRE